MSAHDMAQNTAAQLRALGDPGPAQKHWPAAKTNHPGHDKMKEDVWPIWFGNTSCSKESGDIQQRLRPYRRIFECAPGEDSLCLLSNHRFDLYGQDEKRFRLIGASFFAYQEIMTQSATPRP
jgi:hypothetical protein